MAKPTNTKGMPPSEAEESWIKHAQTEIQKEPARLEEVAKFLVGVVSISLTIFISKRPEGLADWTGAWFVTATVLWMLSVLLSFFVLYPLRYRFNEDSPDSIRKAYQKITNHKRMVLVLSLLSFFVALGLAAYAFLAG